MHRKPAPGGPGARKGPLRLLLALPLLLGGCSSFLFDDEELQPQRIQVQSEREAEPAFPNLASVPDQPPQPSASAQRQELVEGLAADRQHARYSDKPLTPQTAAAETAETSDLSYPPPPSLGLSSAEPAEAEPAPEDDAPGSRMQASDSGPPPDLDESAGVESAGGEEPAMPPPPSQDEPATAADQPPPPVQPDPSAAPPPPETTDTAGDSDRAGEGDLAYPPPTGLLQERAFQQQALAEQRLQRLTAERQAFQQQARQRALEQQWQREQMIQQQTSRADPQQMATVPPAVPPAGPSAPYAAYPPYAAYSQGQPAPPSPVLVPGQLLGLIYFGHGSAGLDARDRQILEQIAALQQSQGQGLRVIGHASARTAIVDPLMHQEANMEMSMRRAQAVADALVQLGADRSRIAVEGAGATRPVYHEFTATGEAGNRRVEILLE